MIKYEFPTLTRTAMNDSEIIAKQARRISELEGRVEVLSSFLQDLAIEIYGAGGPLNDNRLGYSPEQLSTFKRIASAMVMG